MMRKSMFLFFVVFLINIGVSSADSVELLKFDVSVKYEEYGNGAIDDFASVSAAITNGEQVVFESKYLKVVASALSKDGDTYSVFVTTKYKHRDGRESTGTFIVTRGVAAESRVMESETGSSKSALITTKVLIE